MPRIVTFGAPRPDPAFDRPAPERLLAGNPQRTTWEYFINASGEFTAGIWSCEPGHWRIRFAPNKDEFFCVIEGRIRLHEDDGHVVEIGPGGAAVIPGGFSGSFQVVEPVKKYYVVLEREAEFTSAR